MRRRKNQYKIRKRKNQGERKTATIQRIDEDLQNKEEELARRERKIQEIEAQLREKETIVIKNIAALLISEVIPRGPTTWVGGAFLQAALTHVVEVSGGTSTLIVEDQYFTGIRDSLKKKEAQGGSEEYSEE